MYLVNLSLPHYSRASPTQRVYFSVSQLAPVKLIDRCGWVVSSDCLWASSRPICLLVTLGLVLEAQRGAGKELDGKCDLLVTCWVLPPCLFVRICLLSVLHSTVCASRNHCQIIRPLCLSYCLQTCRLLLLQSSVFQMGLRQAAVPDLATRGWL